MRMIVGIIVCVRMFVDVRMIASCISTLVREAVADCAKVPDMTHCQDECRILKISLTSTGVLKKVEHNLRF